MTGGWDAAKLEFQVELESLIATRMQIYEPKKLEKDNKINPQGEGISLK